MGAQTEPDNTTAAVIERSVRVCRWCGQRYTWPVGSTRPGCPRCQLAIDGWEGEKQ